MRHSRGSCIENAFGNLWNFFQNRPQNDTKFLKNRPLELSWSTLGTLLAPRWPKSDAKSKIWWKICNFRVARGLPNGAQIDEKSNWKSTWFLYRFRNHFFLILAWFCVQKPFQNQGSEGHFFDLVANMWKVWFGTTLPSFCYIFQLWKHRFSILNGVFFSCFFEAAFKTYFFRFGVDFWSNLEAK